MFMTVPAVPPRERSKPCDIPSEVIVPPDKLSVALAPLLSGT